MNLRTPFALTAVVGWMLASVPAIAAGDPTMTLTGSGQFNGTYTLQKYAQNGASLTATTPLTGTSALLLARGPGLVIEKASIDDPTGQSAVRIDFDNCSVSSVNSSASGPSASVYVALKCGNVEVRVTPLPSPTALLSRPLVAPALKK